MKRAEHAGRNSGVHKLLPDRWVQAVLTFEVLAKVHDVVHFVVDAAVQRRPGDPGRKAAVVRRHRFELSRLGKRASERRVGVLLDEMIEDAVGHFIHFE